MRRSSTIIRAALCVALLALFAATRLTSAIEVRRQRAGMLIDRELAGQLPADIAAGQVALGSFRGLATTVLWIRAQQLEAEGRYHASIQLARAIARLQPRMIRVWGFLAHNLAFNITGVTQLADERWSWIEAGISLLRDEGLRLNPTSETLYIELAGLYAFKLDGDLDPHQAYYQEQLARRWHRLLGVSASASQRRAQLRRLTAAPRTLEALVGADAAAAGELARLRALGLQPGAGLLAAHERLEQRRRWSAFGVEQPAPSDPTLARLARWEASGDAAARGRLLDVLRARGLRGEALEPARMLALVERYGPIDWRTPAAHQLYWAELGRERGRTPRSMRRELARQLASSLERHVVDALGRLVRHGRVVLDEGRMRREHQLDLLPSYAKACKARIANPELSDGLRRQARENYLGLLGWAVRLAYTGGEPERALRWYRELLAELPDYPPQSLEAFIWRASALQRERRQLTLADTRELLVAVLARAVREGLATGDRRRSIEIVARAQALERFARRAGASALGGLEPLEVLWSEAFYRYLEAPLDEGEGLLRRARAWRHAPLGLRQQVFDFIAPRLGEICRARGLDARQVFAEPPGMDAFRAARRRAGGR